MDAFQAIVLGIVQGLTEFLPISSTGHLLIVPALPGLGGPGAAFTAVIQLGTMAAVLLYFRQDLWRSPRPGSEPGLEPELRGTLDARMGWYLIIGTIPIAIFGLIFNDQIENGARNLYLIGTTLIVFGLVLLRPSGWPSGSARSRTHPRDGVTIGFAQALALIPGVSRSGSTITAGLFLGFDRAAAARFSFLLSVRPSCSRACSSCATSARAGRAPSRRRSPTIVSFIVGYASIACLLQLLATTP